MDVSSRITSLVFHIMTRRTYLTREREKKNHLFVEKSLNCFFRVGNLLLGFTFMNGGASHALQVVSLFRRGHESLENVCECSYLILISPFRFLSTNTIFEKWFFKESYHVTNNFKRPICTVRALSNLREIIKVWRTNLTLVVRAVWC